MPNDNGRRRREGAVPKESEAYREIRRAIAFDLFARDCRRCHGTGGKTTTCRRCDGVGRVMWSQQEIVYAIRHWNSRHRRPPRISDWLDPERGADFPHPSTVIKFFGRWNHAISAAGYEPNPSGSRPRKHLEEAA